MNQTLPCRKHPLSDNLAKAEVHSYSNIMHKAEQVFSSATACRLHLFLSKQIERAIIQSYVAIVCHGVSQFDYPIRSYWLLF